MDLPASVAPFILRGVKLIGINSVTASQARRIEAWSRLSRDLDLGKLAALTSHARLEDVPAIANDIIAGKIRGRVVIDL
jgi:acrylyl-CoA reductase (NADPH)